MFILPGLAQKLRDDFCQRIAKRHIDNGCLAAVAIIAAMYIRVVAPERPDMVRVVTRT